MLLGATLAAQQVLAQPGANPFPKPTPAFLLRPKIAPLPASLADRLRPIGLLATDPQLKSKLAARLESHGRAKGNRGSVASQVLDGKGGTGDRNRLKRPANAKGQRTAPHVGAATVEILDAWVSPSNLDADLRVKAPKYYAAGDVTFRVSGPCGLDYGGPASNDGGTFGCCFYDDAGAELMQIGDHGNHVDKWHLGAGGQTVTLKFSASGLPDVSRTFAGVTGPPRVVKVTLTIDSVAPFLGANAAGIQTANANFGGSSPRTLRQLGAADAPGPRGSRRAAVRQNL